MLYSTCYWKVVAFYKAFLLTKAEFTSMVLMAKMQTIATAAGTTTISQLDGSVL
jgi:hypothetical protein